jgi:integrase
MTILKLPPSQWLTHNPNAFISIHEKLRSKGWTEIWMDLRCKKLTTPGRHADGGGLYLFVSKVGCKSWVFVFTRGGKKRELGLGAYPITTLVRARQKAKEHRLLLSEGKAPRSHKEAARTAVVAAGMTLGAACDRFIELHIPEWRKNTLLTWQSSFRKTRCPLLWAMPLAAVTSADIVENIKDFKLTARSYLLTRLAQVYDWAEELKFVPTDFNPAKIKLKRHIPVEKHEPKHFASLAWKDAPAFVRSLRALQDRVSNKGRAAYALELEILTGVRPAEAREAKWEEFNLDAAVWSIPRARMKKDKLHRVPLSEQALALLSRVKNNNSELGFLFPGPRAKTISSTDVMKICREQKVTAHGFRSTFDDWSAERQLSFELTELSLAHKFGSRVSQAYRRTDLLEQRRVLMQQWADFLDGADSTS